MTNKQAEDNRRKAEERRGTSDRREMVEDTLGENEIIELDVVPENRRRKTIRRSGEERRKPS